MIIDCFGLHYAAGIPFLVQASGVTNLISADLKSPFQLHITPRRTRCPHQIDLNTTAPLPGWCADPLSRLFLPTPRTPGEKVKIVYDRDLRYEGLINQLSRLSSPTGSFARPVWWRTPKDMRAMYSVTNLTPVVIMCAEVRHSPAIYEHLSYAVTFNRKVVVFARERLPIFGEAEWITSELASSDLKDQPLEAIGAGELRRIMEDQT